MNEQELQELATHVILDRVYDIDLEDITSSGYSYLGANIAHEDAQKVRALMYRSLVRVSFPTLPREA